MLKQIADLVAQLLGLTRDVQQNKTGLKELAEDTAHLQKDYNELRLEVRDLAAEVRALRNEVQAGWQAQARERQMLLLQLENALLRRDAGLPPRAITGESAPTNSEENAE